jgi:hypothetical protein
MFSYILYLPLALNLEAALGFVSLIEAFVR